VQEVLSDKGDQEERDEHDDTRPQPNPANHAMSADGKRGSISTQDPYIERHAEVVQRLGNGSLR
jgi:hypothetical protein